MKKIITLFTLIFLINISKAQTKIIVSDYDATASNSFPFYLSNNIAAIKVTTDINFNGTTSVIKLQGGFLNPDSKLVEWVQLYQDDNTSEMSYTLNQSNSNYVFQLKNAFYYRYKVIYTSGDATAGKINIIMSEK